jgi:cyclopropane-fatty-acyl-phospholipid synthase
MSMLAAEKYGADVTCYGLVGTQNDGMRELMRARCFGGKVTLVEKDHRELADEPGRYDRFVSSAIPFWCANRVASQANAWPLERARAAVRS